MWRIIRGVGESQRSYPVSCPVCMEDGAELTVQLSVDTGHGNDGSTSASSRVTFVFWCRRGCKPHAVELREMWAEMMHGGTAKPDTA